MTREQRLNLIDRLQAANAASLDELARRQEERAADPNSELEWLMADQRFTRDQSDLIYSDPAAEPEPSPPVEKSGAPHVIYRRFETPLPVAAGVARAALYATDPPAEEDELADAVDKFAQAVENRLAELEGELVKRDRQISELRGECVEVQGLLRNVLGKLAALETVAKGFSAKVDSERKDREALFASLETKLAELRGILRGAMNDWNGQ
jgi:hypothetical protein